MLNKSTHFTTEELQCKCCKQCDMNETFIVMLERTRRFYNKPMIVNSAFRCDHHNREVGGVQNSLHKRGLAIDVACEYSVDRFELVSSAIKAGFNEIGIYSNFVHIGYNENKSSIFLK